MAYLSAHLYIHCPQWHLDVIHISNSEQDPLSLQWKQLCSCCVASDVVHVHVHAVVAIVTDICLHSMYVVSTATCYSMAVGQPWLKRSQVMEAPLCFSDSRDIK